MLERLRAVGLGAAMLIAAGAAADLDSTSPAEERPLPCSSAPTPSTATSRLGTFRYVIPPGRIPRIGPIEMADQIEDRGVHLRRAGGSVREIVCMAYSRKAKNGDGAWSIHARGSFWSRAPFEGSSCRATEAVIVVWEDGNGAGISLRGAECVEGRGLTKGR